WVRGGLGGGSLELRVERDVLVRGWQTWRGEGDLGRAARARRVAGESKRADAGGMRDRARRARAAERGACRSGRALVVVGRGEERVVDAARGLQVVLGYLHVNARLVDVVAVLEGHADGVVQGERELV